MQEKCCSRTSMYEGKNIHYSSADSKLLCSFSGKLCNQRRLNGYGFCVRHILEDPTAPFRRCAYVAKSSNQMCTQAIPNHEERRFDNCNISILLIKQMSCNH
ncbi:INO80 complex subunit D [Elysia marginata]|uniref:INO80 complex subunit D n=1 Tax=Elysia marginata TaxID=1093978 RepID=A0AAV4JL21_9GAST|nr:INO80 complex subunit D [Elysia marginata]